jgi:hypothetical protein
MAVPLPRLTHLAQLVVASTLAAALSSDTTGQGPELRWSYDTHG